MGTYVDKTRQKNHEPLHFGLSRIVGCSTDRVRFNIVYLLEPLEVVGVRDPFLPVQGGQIIHHIPLVHVDCHEGFHLYRGMRIYRRERGENERKVPALRMPRRWNMDHGKRVRGEKELSAFGRGRDASGCLCEAYSAEHEHLSKPAMVCEVFS